MNAATAMAETIAPASGNALFVHNMRALWRRDPELAILVDAVHDDDRFALAPTRSGHWTTQVESTTGPQTFLHSRYDPINEAKRFASSIDIDDKYCIVVSGLGLGYHVKALFERLKGDAFILCGEPSVRMIATALTCVDLSEAISADRLIFLTDGTKARLHSRLGKLNTLMMLGAQFAQHLPSMRVAQDDHAEITQAISEFVAFSRMSLLTLVSNSQITCKNIAMNFVNYVGTPPIDMLQNRFASNPAIVIAAGPSLARNIERLSNLKGKAVLCAVQTALKPLAELGVVPDFATSLDFHEMSRKFFDDVPNLADVHLVAEPKATWSVIDDYPGPVSLLDNQWARLVLGDAAGARGALPAGATVAHLAFYLAVYMGCDPIIFVGQDLAFTGHVFYVPGVEIHRAWRGELNRFQSIEQKEWDRIARNRPILHKVTAHDGSEVYTDELLLTYLEQFEKDIAGIGRTVVNATEGGAHIHGTRSMTLAEVEKQYCSKPIAPERFAYRSETKWRRPDQLGAARHQIEQRITELDGVIAVCDELIELLHELDGLTGDAARFNQRLIRVDELRAQINRESRPFQIVNAYTQMVELRRYSADRRINALDATEVDRAKEQIVRDVEFITGVRDGARDIKPILADSLKRIVEGIESA